MLSRPRVLAATRGRIVGDALRPLGLSLRDRRFDFLYGFSVGFAGLQEQLEEDSALELLERVRHLVP